MHALSEVTQRLADKVQLSSLPLHAQDILAAFVFYQFTFAYVSPFVWRRIWSGGGDGGGGGGGYDGLDVRRRVNFDTHTVSMIQCLIINTLAIGVIRTDPQRALAAGDWRERLWGYSRAAGRVQGYAAGYFLWDTLASVRYLDIMGGSSLLHGVAALSVTMLGFRPFANHYGINFVLYELSTPFLNVHWFLDKFGMTGSTAQLLNAGMLLASFFGCRIIWGAYQSYQIYTDVWKAWYSDLATSPDCIRFLSATKPVNLMHVPVHCRSLPTWLGAFYVGANTALMLLNVYWFTKMVAAVRKRFQTSKKAQQISNKKAL